MNMHTLCRINYVPCVHYILKPIYQLFFFKPSCWACFYKRIHWSSFFSSEKAHSQCLVRIITPLLESSLCTAPTASLPYHFVRHEKTATSGRIMKDLVPLVDECGGNTDVP